MAKSAKITKTEAVKQTLAAGVQKPVLGVAYIKKEFGLDMTTAMFSNYKSVQAAKGSSRKKKGKMAAKAPATRSSASVDGLSLARDVKAVVEKYGADAVKGMAEILGT